MATLARLASYIETILFSQVW